MPSRAVSMNKLIILIRSEQACVAEANIAALDSHPDPILLRHALVRLTSSSGRRMLDRNQLEVGEPSCSIYLLLGTDARR